MVHENNWKGVGATSEGEKQRPTKPPAAVSHVGGVSDQLGGVDPEADSNLVRLSGGP